MRELACSTYAFLGMPLREAFRGIGDAGFACAELVLHDSPEWGHLRPADIMREPESLAMEVRSSMEDGGIRVIAATMSFDENIAWQRGEFEAACRFMRSLRIRVVTIPAGRKDERTESFRLRDYREIAAKHGIVLSVEAQSMVAWGDSLFLLPWNAGNFASREPGHRITLDTGHMLHAGVRQEDWPRIYEYTAHVHVRDARQGDGLSQVPFGEGEIRLDSLLAGLKAAHYSGSFTVEYLKGWGEGRDLDPVRESIRMREAIEEAMEKLDM